ncbi:hypothetical protein FB451DRAFT_1365825 [Mycena latifolia]|nr:hypothetical protein FB451DRAFT_1365825 [Mycena latifolia]
MHRCWTVPEIVDIIFSHISPYPFPSRNVTLFRLAITCRAFLPALDPLWRTQYSLSPLLKCLPHVWDHSQSHFDFSRVTTPSDWNRLLSYACRIKWLSLYSREIPRLETMEFLNIAIPVDCLFPNIEYLYWAPADHKLLPYTRLLLGPKIKSVSLGLNGPASRLALLPWLGSKYPKIASVHVFISEVEADPIQCIHYVSSMVRALTNVHTLSVNGLDVTAFEHLGSLATLEALDIRSVETPLFSGNVPSQPAFPSLRKLNIDTAVSLDLCTNLIGGLSKPMLEELEIVSVHQPATETQSSIFFSGMHDHLQHTSLTSLDLDLGPLPDDPANPELYTVRSSTLRPLLAFGNLDSVQVFLPYRIFLDNDFVATMAAAWPRVTDICFAPRDIIGVAAARPTVTLTALSAFARHCPNLRRLRMPIDATNVPTPAPCPAQTMLKSLEVLNSPIDSAFAAAAFLSAVFPSLEEIEWDIDVEVEDPDLANVEADATWKEVEKLVPMFVRIRAEDEKRWRDELAG